MATKIIVDIPGEQSYDVRIGAGVLESLGQQLMLKASTASIEQILIIADDRVASLYLDHTKATLAAAGYKTRDVVIPAGESSKSLEVAGEIWEAMAQLSLARDSLVIALGGGVVGDLAGFVASTYMRGVSVVQVPTTLLAMVDSSVGGKTAVNLVAGKNLVGTFLHPAYVCADTTTLATLPEREWACGCAEIAKSAVIDSDEFFFWLVDNAAALSSRDDEVTAEAIARSVVFKANIVAEDKLESCGVRECLNYGHTLGHALESLAGYGTFSHGAAVAEGMRFAARLSVVLADASPEFVTAQDHLLDTLGLSVLDWSASPQEILSVMKRDKKVRQGSVRFVLPRDIGAWELLDVADEVILEHLTALRQSRGSE